MTIRVKRVLAKAIKKAKFWKQKLLDLWKEEQFLGVF